MGELHLEVIQHRLQRDFKLNVKVHKPRVSYRETIGGAAEVDGECHRIINGVQHTAKVRLRVEPLRNRRRRRRSSRRVARRSMACRASSWPWCWKNSKTPGRGAACCGFPLMRVKATLLGGEVHETESSDIAFRTAAEPGVRRRRCAMPATVLLEPIMKLEISTPDEHVGDLVGDLQQRRAIINHTRIARPTHGAARRGPAGETVRLLQRDAELEPGPGELLDGTPSTYAAAPDEVLKRFMGDE